LVLLGDDDGIYTKAVCRQYLILDAADRKHLTTQRDFPSHGDVALGCASGNQRGQRGCHRHTSRWPIFRYSTCRNVDMDVVLLEESLVDAEVIGLRANVAEGSLGTFRHDITELSSELEAFATGHPCRFDEQHITTDWSPCQASCHTGNIGAF